MSIAAQVCGAFSARVGHTLSGEVPGPVVLIFSKWSVQLSRLQHATMISETPFGHSCCSPHHDLRHRIALSLASRSPAAALLVKSASSSHNHAIIVQLLLQVAVVFSIARYWSIFRPRVACWCHSRWLVCHWGCRSVCYNGYVGWCNMTWLTHCDAIKLISDNISWKQQYM